MWLSCQAINWISVLAGLFQVFANQVTYYMLRSNVQYSVDLHCCIPNMELLGQEVARIAIM